MNLLILVLVAFIAFAIALKIFGDYLGKLVGLDDSKKTPAHTMTDGVDYIPTKAPVLMGHHLHPLREGAPF